MKSRLGAIVPLIIFFGLVAAAAAFGALFKPGPWYAGLAKPTWTPPNTIFAPVWSALYLMIALAGWLAWRSRRQYPAIGAWGVGLLLNMTWSWLFFGRHLIGAALVDILALWCAINVFLLTTRQSSPAAFWLFVPYLLWVSFAAALNLQIWRLNS